MTMATLHQLRMGGVKGVKSPLLLPQGGGSPSLIADLIRDLMRFRNKLKTPITHHIHFVKH